MNLKFTSILSVSIVVIILILSLATFLPATLYCNDIAKCSVNHVQKGGIFNETIFLFSNLFSTEYWPARWNCGNWSAIQGWTSIVSDFIIFASYFGIPVTIFYFQRKLTISDILYKDIARLFGLFILACGLTHLIDVIIFWQPIYNLSVSTKLFTAIISALTLIVIMKKFPLLMEFKSPAQLTEIINNKTSELVDSETELIRQLELNNRLFKESQHRIKNNLQLISSLIYLKLSSNNTLDASGVESVLDRINSIGKVNELLLRSNIMNEVVMQPYLEQFIDSLNSIESKNINWKLNLDDNLKLDSEKAVYCGLICFEFISNSIKHGFKTTDDPTIEITLKKTSEEIHFNLHDNGNGGFNENKNETGFGLGLIENFVGYINGESEWERSSNGTSLFIKFF